MKKFFSKIKNRILVDKFPWLMPVNVWTGKPLEDYDYSYTLYDEIPDGWRKCFGKMMIKEMHKASGGEIYTEQIKEKYGELRWYCSANEETQRIISKYSFISQHVCIDCGRPDTYITNTGWICPICESCWNKNKSPLSYKEVVCEEEGENIIPDSYRVSRFSKDGEELFEYDISDTVCKIRRKWRFCK